MSNLDEKLNRWKAATESPPVPDGLLERIVARSGTRPASPRPADLTVRAPIPADPTLPLGAHRPLGRPARSRRSSAAWWAAGAVAAGAMLVVLGRGELELRRRRAADENAAMTEQQKRDQAEAQYQQGKSLVQQLDFQSAVQHFQQAKADGADDADLDDYLSRALREAQNQALYEAARQHMLDGELSKAADTATQISPDSLYRDTHGLMEVLMAAIKQRVPDRLATARDRIQSHDFAAASHILDDLQHLDPTNPDVSSQQRELALLEHRPPPVHITSVVRTLGPDLDIIKAFDAGDIGQAKKLAAQLGETDDKVRALGQKIAEFEAAYALIDSDPAALRRARDLNHQISGGSSTFTATLNTRVVALDLRDGASAQSAGDLRHAFQAYSDAHRTDPGNALASEQLKALRAKAKEMYLQAYVLKATDIEAARKLFLQVREMTPPDDDFHRKAQQHLEEMGEQ